MKVDPFRAFMSVRILHEMEKLRGALKQGKATEKEVREAAYNFYLGASAPGTGGGRTVIAFSELLPYFDGDEDLAEALATKIESKGGVVTR